MRVLIVDDERPARDKLRRLLAQHADITAVDEAIDGYDALDKLASFQPDLMLLDIEMPEVSGIELVASLPQPAPLVIFVTAYDHYAIKAFDANAIDYLLKPYDSDRFTLALERAYERLRTRAPAVPLPYSDGHPLRQLLIAEKGVKRVLKIEQIQWIETADNYVVLHTENGQPLLRQTLVGLLDALGPGFMRCHRRAAVQLDWIEQAVTFEKGDGELLLRGGARVPCSRQYRAAVLARL